jgi:hypothetical protein
MDAVRRDFQKEIEYFDAAMLNYQKMWRFILGQNEERPRPPKYAAR